MKTIQQVLIETDHKSIESAYFYEHPINLWEVKDFDDITIGEFNNSISARFQDFLNRLCEMNAEASPEKQGILFVYKSQMHDIILDEAVGLIHADELMGMIRKALKKKRNNSMNRLRNARNIRND